jgi:hypothetical protein
VRSDPALTIRKTSIPGQLCRLLQHVTDYLLDIRLRAGIRPARERMEKKERIDRNQDKRTIRAVAIKGEYRMAQTGKKTGKSRISEDDWNRYVDAVRRQAARKQPLKHLDLQKELET